MPNLSVTCASELKLDSEEKDLFALYLGVTSTFMFLSTLRTRMARIVLFASSQS